MADPARNPSRREMATRPGPPAPFHLPGSSAIAQSSAQMPAQFDGPRDKKAGAGQAPSQSHTRNLDGLGISTWSKFQGIKTTWELPKRKGQFCQLGREAQIGLNTFDVIAMPDKPVFQYDVTVAPANGETKDASRVTIMKIWHSQAVSSKLGKGGWLFDGNKIGWAIVSKGRTEIEVDLNVEDGRKTNGKNQWRVRIEPTKQVSFTTLQAYLDGKADFDVSIIEALACLDHLMREWPSQHYTQIKKSFFNKGETRFDLGDGIEAFKGVFASCRMALNAAGHAGLSVNVDVANGTFFSQQDLMLSLIQLCRMQNDGQLSSVFASAKGNKWKESALYRLSRAFTHVSVAKKYLKGRECKVARFLDKDPYEQTFTLSDGKQTTVAQYFKEHYKYQPRRGLPLVELTKKGDFVPLEMLVLQKNQRFRPKLNDKQTAQMVRFAATPPAERWNAVQHGLDMLAWPKDPFLKAYGMQISSQRTTVKGRILQAPEPTFGNGKIPSSNAAQGRWRIDGKTFLENNSKKPITSWGVGIVQHQRARICNPAQAKTFFTTFMQKYRGHGGLVQVAPIIMELQSVRGGEMINDLWMATGTQFNKKPDILFFILPQKDTELYTRIKKSCDCRFGVVSQVLQSQHVIKNDPQYHSNVCMKVNAKLFGSTCFANGSILPRLYPLWLKKPTMIIGADVSHPAPGDDSHGSMAALTMSLDKKLVRYAAQVQSNGCRVEIISTSTIDTTLKGMVQYWASQQGGVLPESIIYYRDGVSEAQYQFVLNQEVADMKAMFASLGPTPPKFTVIICGKRHHIRFFPQGCGDRTGNAPPGTLVEKGCTHPFEFDFYLSSHAAIKGTARPVHYHVIADENKYPLGFLQQMTFESSFQYARSTTPVNIPPPVYYAHLAALRARAHVNRPELSSGKKQEHEAKQGNQNQAQETSTSDLVFPPLMVMPNTLGIRGTMWYI